MYLLMFTCRSGNFSSILNNRLHISFFQEVLYYDQNMNPYSHSVYPTAENIKNDIEKIIQSFKIK